MKNENTTEPQDFDASLKFFLASMQDMCQKYHDSMGYKFPPGVLTPIPGKKYVRIASVESVSRHAWAFVEKETGDIFKPASWAAPAKHARGNIYRPESWQAFTPYGPNYLRNR